MTVNEARARLVNQANDSRIPEWNDAMLRSPMIFVFVLCCLSLQTFAENWPQWRGPRNDGVSSETGIATHWSKTENVSWRLPLPGQAGATPVVIPPVVTTAPAP